MAATNYPAALDSGTNLPSPASTNFLDDVGFLHADMEATQSTAVIAVETKIGTGASTPIASRVLRGTGVGTSSWAQLVLTTDVTGTLPVANGGTGATTSTGTTNVVLSGSPTIVTPTIASFANANHDHSNSAGGGAVQAANLKNSTKFAAWRSAAANSGNNAFALVTFDNKEFDTGTNYSVSTGLFTAPQAGFYSFSWGIAFQANSVTCFASLFKNGSEFKRGSRCKIAADNISSTGAALLQLSLSDTIQIDAFAGTTTALEVGQPQCYFTGFMVSAT